VRQPWQRLYKRKGWQVRRRQQLLAQPLCEFCLREKRLTPARIADHVVPHRGDVNLFMLGRLQSLCKPCHDIRKRIVEEIGYDRDIGLDGWPLDPRHPANKVRARCSGGSDTIAQSNSSEHSSLVMIV
jgi:hypothetical protein